MTPQQKAFIVQVSRVASATGERPGRVFEQWLEAAYCAVAKSTAGPDRGQALETRYRQVADRDRSLVQTYAELLGDLMAAFEQTPGHDFLGPIAGELGALNAGLGQFFTPWNVAECMARLMLMDVTAQLDEKPYLTIGDPAVGSGALLLAAAHVLREQGVPIHRRIWFDGTDVADVPFKMAFLQLTFAGCAGIVRRGDSLSNEMRELALTPLVALWPHAMPGARDTARPQTPTIAVPAAPQLALFEA